MTRRGRKALDGLADDLRDHIEHQTEENLARGMTPDEARRQARLALGNTALIEEDTRAVWVSRWLEDLRRDLRYALRIFRRSPGFAATAVVSLAVGIAAATGLFSVVNAALLNPFPFADINRIVRLDMNDKGKPRGLFVTARQLVALQQQRSLRRRLRLEHLGDDADRPGPPGNGGHASTFPRTVWTYSEFRPSSDESSTRRTGRRASRPRRVVVLTYRFWQRHFGGRPEAVGQTLYLKPRTLHRDWRAATSILFHWSGDSRSP